MRVLLRRDGLRPRRRGLSLLLLVTGLIFGASGEKGHNGHRRRPTKQYILPHGSPSSSVTLYTIRDETETLLLIVGADTGPLRAP